MSMVTGLPSPFYVVSRLKEKGKGLEHNARAREALDVEQALIWAYRDQKVAAGRGGIGPRGFAGATRDGTAAAAELHRLGCRVDVSPGAAAAREQDLPIDAVEIDRVVRECRLAALLVPHAEAGSRPLWGVPRRVYLARHADGKPIWSSDGSGGLRPVVIEEGDGPHLVELRAGWDAWWRALLVLAEHAAGRLRTLALLPPSVPRRPWDVWSLPDVPPDWPRLRRDARDLRKAGLSQAAVAAWLGISREAVSKWENRC